ncbi:MAG: hypothetical protein GKR89_26355, partial [Candidatus Latescibacteria bacterium]|nr:hypothetical protein [Candidatus Latescibacterota bacterium]
MNVCLPAERARRFGREMLAQAGVDTEEAHLCAEALVEADLRGVKSHGLALLPTYIERIHSGQIRPGTRWLIRREGPTTALCDGQGGLGPVLAAAAVDLAAAKAQQYGLGSVSLANGNYLGALAYYAQRPTHRGLIALCTANASPRVVPYGGRQGLHGTNPLCYAIPSRKGAPLIFDAATGHAAARVKQAAAAGHPLPADVALDRDGHPTTDPQQALAGFLQPVGGPLGYGLGLLVDLLSGALAGGPCGLQVPQVDQLDGPYGCGFFALVLDPDRFAGRSHLAYSTAALAAQARTTPPRPGGPAVRMPGDRAQQQTQQQLGVSRKISTPHQVGVGSMWTNHLGKAGHRTHRRSNAAIALWV